MIDLPLDLKQHLAHAGTIVVPTRQRAAAVRLAHGAALLADGLRVWGSPDVLPWSGWLQRELEQARLRGVRVPARLSAISDWLLWRDSVTEAASELPVLAPERLVDAVRQAVGLLDDYALEPQSSTPEATFLLAARAAYRRRCRQLGVVGTASWHDCAPFVQPRAAPLLAGFDTPGPGRRRWLQRCGIGAAAQLGFATGPATVQVLGLDDAAAEAQAAAEWCAAALVRNPSARLLIVVPRLAEQRQLWQHVLSGRLDYPAMLDPPTAAAQSGANYAIEGGAPLAQYPPVAVALSLVALASARTSFERVSSVLRSSYVGLDRAACLRLDLWLRDQGVDVIDAAVLQAALTPATAALGSAAADVIRTLLQALAAVQEAASVAPHAPGAHWARAWADLLGRCGWPGTTPLGSYEQQVRMRFEELLGELGTSGPATGRLSLSAAAALLQQLAQRTAFEPASDDAPVTVTGYLEDPIVRYDGVWIAGLTAEAWPPAASPDPFIPLSLQRDAGIAASSAAGQLQRARQLQQRWLRAGVSCVLSWPRSEQDLPADPSPLLQELQITAASPVVVAARAGSTPIAASLPAVAEGFTPERWLATVAPALESWQDQRGPVWAAGRRVRGGTRLLELQGRCPFRSFAELRLGAQELQSPSPGIDSRLRGRLLHRALELLWRELRDQDGLRGLSDAAQRALARDSVASALRELSASAATEVRTLLLAREGERCCELIGRLLEWERSRPHFVVQALESAQSLLIGGTALQLRLDRIDRLDDGRLVVIDYKSGAAATFDAHAERPPQPQLPAYALVAGEQVAAVAALHLTRDSVRLRGLADRRDRLPRLPAVAQGELAWPQLLRDWQQRLQTLVLEFVAGHATVTPQGQACEECHLHLLCRIDAGQLAGAQADADVGVDEAETADAGAGVAPGSGADGGAGADADFDSGGG